jgi:hypothetical protein
VRLEPCTPHLPSKTEESLRMSQLGSDSQAEIVARTRAWMRENHRHMSPDWTPGDDEPLLRTGVLDLIGLIKLVEFLQSAFACDIVDEEIVDQNLGSLRAIGRFVHAKGQGGTAAAAWRVGGATAAGAGVLLRPRA